MKVFIGSHAGFVDFLRDVPPEERKEWVLGQRPEQLHGLRQIDEVKYQRKAYEVMNRDAIERVERAIRVIRSTQR